MIRDIWGHPCCSEDTHVFVWSAHWTSDGEPPEGTPCRCGKTVYHKQSLLPHEDLPNEEREEI